MLLLDMSIMVPINNAVSGPTKPSLENAAQTKEERNPLIVLRNGKVTLKQRLYSLEKMSETMQETVKFRDFLEQWSKENKSPLQSIPEAHLPLIAKLVYESDKSLASLTKHVQQVFTPEDHDDSERRPEAVVSGSAIESAISSVAERVNYGIDWIEKITAPLSVWRWEVRNDRFDLLPKAARDKIESRLAERQQAKRDLRLIYDSLPEAERASLGKANRKTNSSTANEESKNALADATVVNNVPSKNVEDAAIAGAEEKKAVVRPKKEKELDPEQIQKENELAEKRAAKLEKDRKKEESQNKSRSIMSAFFSKPKASSKTKLLKTSSSNSAASSSDPSSSKPDFERLFKPFIVKKNAKIAPINSFRTKILNKDVIDVDDEADSISKSCIGPKINADDRRESKELLDELLTSTRMKSRFRRCTGELNNVRYKTYSELSVRETMARLSEAEVIGNAEDVRSILDDLQSREKFPAKVIVFDEDMRPGYFGTFTKSSTVVGPRSPFAKDPVSFDYSYDSGEEWEDEGEGDDLLSNHGSDVDASSDVNSDDMDGWLVDDDDIGDPGTPFSERGGSPTFPPLPHELPVKRKPDGDKSKKEPKKRKVIPLVPFVKESRMEERIGDCEDEVFRPFRIQLFNDTPFPIDPFTFVSTPITKLPKPSFAVPAVPLHAQASNGTPIQMQNLVPPNQGALPLPIPVMVAPNIPIYPHNNANFSPIRYQPVPGPGSSPVQAKRVPVQPKEPFPAALMPYLADKVASLNSGNLTWLIESLYRDLKAHGVKKISVEAKVREDCEKCPQRKVWVVKNSVLASLTEPVVSLQAP